MRKEIVIAIVFGGILGIVVAFGIWRVNSALSPKNKTTETVQASPTPKSGFIISLAKPENNDVITTSPLEINGLTHPNATVAISAEAKDYLTDANTQGLFGESVNLTGGVNQLLLTAFDETGNSVTSKVLVVYSSEFKKIMENLPTSEPATSAADTVRAKVEKKVEEVLNKPKAYIGLVTDISEATIQIKTPEGEIKQIGTVSDTVYIKDGTSPKIVTFKDLAIGDFIVAMGLPNGNAVLNAKRILITSPLSDPKREAILGKVVKVTSKDFVISQSLNQQALSITPNKGALYFSKTRDKFTKAKFVDLKEEAQVVVVGVKGEKSFSARTIFIVATGS